MQRIKITRHPSLTLDTLIGHTHYQNSSQADFYRADPVDMSGTPPNGEGRSIAEAIGSLILGMQAEERTWTKYGWPEFEIEDQTK